MVTAGSADDDDTDADAWEAMLRERGFTVHRLLNPSSAQFEKGFSEFLGTASTGPTLNGQSAIVPSGSVAPAASSGPEANSLFVLVFVGEAAQVNGQTRTR